jgi:CRISPR-associated protein Cas5d
MTEYTNKTFCLEVRGDFACFTRPEMKVERVSYDVITPSAARAIFEAIFWKPAIRWQVRKIEVLQPIRWTSVRRNEVAKIASAGSEGIFVDDGNTRQQRAGLFLRDVAYRLHAELIFIPPPERAKILRPVPDDLVDPREMVDWAKDENPGKYNGMFERRARKGQCFNQPYLGCREFSCAFRLVEETESVLPPIEASPDLGFMIYDMDFRKPDDPQPMFFRARMDHGVIDVPDRESPEVLR